MSAVLRRKLIVEPVSIETENGFLVLHEDGQVVFRRDAAAVVRHASASDRSAVAKGAPAAVTTIEWRGMPEGFTPPQPKGVSA